MIASRAALRRLLVPGLSTAVMLAILCGLGVWQVQRLHWKTALLDRIAQAEAAPGVALPPHPAPFQKLRLAGVLRPGAIGRYGVEVRDTAQGSVLGSQLVGLLDHAAALPVVVLLGWTPQGWTSQDRPATLPPGPTTLEGYARLPAHPGMFSASDDPAARQFYTLDPAVIGRVLGAPAVMPFALVAMGQPRPGVYPAPSATMPRPPNDHLRYAITWFGLAATLLVIFAIYARRVLSA